MSAASLALSAALLALGPVAGPTRVAFEQNLGQLDPRVRFVGRSAGGTVFLTDTEVVLALRGAPRALHLRLLNAQATTPKGVQPLALVIHSFQGSNPTRWKTNVPAFGRVRYPEVYPGVDLELDGAAGDLEINFNAVPGADLRHIALAFEGASATGRNEQGSLWARLGGRTVELGTPEMRTRGSGDPSVHRGAYVQLGDGRFGLELGEQGRSTAWVVDPVLAYSTYFGGNGSDQINAVAQDPAGNIYVAGKTTSTTFPSVNGLEPYDAGYDAFFSKFDATGKSLLYSTYLGGSVDDQALALGLDDTGAVYVAGATTSRNFPVRNSLETYKGESDGFVAKFSQSGTAVSLVFSTYFGGTNNDFINALALDDAGYVYLAGCAGENSLSFPIWNAFQPTFGGGNGDAFVARLNGANLADTSLPTFSTFLGGSGYDCATGLALSAQGEIDITGTTQSSNFPLFAPLPGQIPADGGAAQRGFVATVSSTGQSVPFSSYLGGSGYDTPAAIAADGAGNIFVAGKTRSTDFPIVGDAGLHFSGYEDGFVTKLAPHGASFRYSLVLGGTGATTLSAVAVSDQGVAYAAGSTNSPQASLPLVNTMFDRRGTSDALVAMIDPAGSTLIYATLLGGGGDDEALALTLGDGGTLLVGGTTSSVDFPGAQGGWQGGFKDAGLVDAGPLIDGFIARIALPPPSVASVTPDSGSTSGNTAVNVLGVGFLSPASVLFGGAPALAVSAVGATGTELLATTPPHDAGTVDVTVVNADGQSSTLSNAFTYLALSVALIEPPAQTVDAGQSFILDARGSSPSPTGTLSTSSFLWSQPQGPTAAALDAGALQTLTLDVPGTYHFVLQVVDSSGVLSLPTTAQVQVNGVTPGVPSYRFGCGCGSGEGPWAAAALLAGLALRRRFLLRRRRGR